MNYLTVAKNAFTGWGNDKASVWAASLAYFTIFSLSPLLLLITGLVGIFFGEQAIQGKLFSQIDGLVGPDAAAIIQEGVSNTSKPSGNIISTIIGIVALILGAIGIFDQMQQAFNAIWKVKTKPKAGIGVMIKDKLLSFSMLLIIGFLLAVSIGLSFITNILTNSVQSFYEIPVWALEILNNGISFIVLVVLFALMFKILPDIKISFKNVLPGAIFTAFLFVVGKFALGWYIGQSAYTSTYGAAGALMVLLVWVYYAIQILLYGAEFTRAYALEKGLKVQPSHNAVSTETQEQLSAKPKPQKVKEQEHKDDIKFKGAAIAGMMATGIAAELIDKKKKKAKKKKK